MEISSVEVTRYLHCRNCHSISDKYIISGVIITENGIDIGFQCNKCKENTTTLIEFTPEQLMKALMKFIGESKLILTKDTAIIEPPSEIGTCILVYRDHTCKYKGIQPSCDKTPEDCRRHNNFINFGGVPV